MFREGRCVAGKLLIDPGQRSPGLMRSFVLRSPGLKSFPSLVRSPGLMRSPILRSPVLRSSGLMMSFGLKRSSGLMRSPVLRSPRLMRSPDLVRSPGLMRSPFLRSPVLRSTELMRYPVLRAPILRPPVPRPPDLMRSPDLMGSPDLMRSSDLDRSPGLMRSLVLKADSTCTSPLMRSSVLSSPVPRSPVLYLYLEKFSDLSGVKELVSRPMIGMKFSRLRNMTAMGVQIVGTLLNKTISTGDDWWGERWNLIQESLRCYALGDIQFGFMTYNILSGLMLRDVFPDPEVLCRYLKCNQKEAADWFLEFLMVSLEGVEYQQKAEEEAETREEMILSLRYRDEQEKLCEFSPPLVLLWSRILGKWPSPTSGGCQYLLEAREWFLFQITTLAEAGYTWSKGKRLEVPGDEDKEYARFGLDPEELEKQDWSGSARGFRGWERP